MTPQTVVEAEPAGHPARLIDAMHHGGRSDPEVRALLKGASDRLPVGLDQPAPSMDGGFHGAWVMIVGLILLLVVAVLRSASPAAKAWDATSFVPGADPDRFLVMTVPGVGGLAETQAMEQSQRNAIRAALSCTDRAHGSNLSPSGIGGPSAGLILAIALVDRLDGLELGLRVAGTGTISSTGEVGPVVAVAEKAAGAEAAGAELFLVPADQADDAMEAVGDLPVAGVRSLDEALRVLVGSGCPA